MSTEQLLYKWQDLNTDEQSKVLAFIDSLKHQKQSSSKLGQKLRKIRQ